MESPADFFPFQTDKTWYKKTWNDPIPQESKRPRREGFVRISAFLRIMRTRLVAQTRPRSGEDAVRMLP